MLAKVTQCLGITPRHDTDPTFSFPWYGTIGGPALGVDPNPNTTPPAAGRIVRCSPRPGNTLTGGVGAAYIIGISVPTASMTLQAWVYDDSRARWVEYSTPALSITAANTLASITMENMLGSKWFFQIVANTAFQAVTVGFY